MDHTSISGVLSVLRISQLFRFCSGFEKRLQNPETLSEAPDECPFDLVSLLMLSVLGSASLLLCVAAYLQVKRLQGQVAVAEAQISMSQGQTGEVRNIGAARTGPWGSCE